MKHQIATKTSEYWLIDDEYNKNTYRSYGYQFYENGEYKLFVIRRNTKQIHPYSGGDIIYPDNKWKLFDDSIKIGNNNFKLDIINDSILVLKNKKNEERILKTNYKNDYVKMKNTLN
ncbi:hypothetical protein ACX3PU_07455 [Chryseobacterium sp. A301]